MLVINRLFHLPFFILNFIFAFIWYVLYKIFGADNLLNTAIGFDQTANAMFGGNPDQTVSGRLGRKIRDNNCVACKYFCKILSWFFNEDYHCIKSIEDDEA